MRRPTTLTIAIALAAFACGGATPADEPAPSAGVVRTEDASPAKDSGGDVLEKVQRSRQDLVKSLLASPEDEGERIELKRIIKKLRSIEVKRQKKSRPAPQPETEPVETTEKPEATAEPKKEATEPDGLTPAELARLRKLPAEKIANPIGLADALYLGGYTAEARVFYDRVLQTDPDDETKAWVLFQVANCCRGEKPDEAVTLYKRLENEYPQSVWTSAARAIRTLIQWRRTTHPEAHLAPDGLATGPASTPTETEAP